MLKGVQYIHSRGVLHRDIKPENIRLTRPTREWLADPAQLKLKIIDFGLSCVLGGKPETGWLGSPGALPLCAATVHNVGAAGVRQRWILSNNARVLEQGMWRQR